MNNKLKTSNKITINLKILKSERINLVTFYIHT